MRCHSLGTKIRIFEIKVLHIVYVCCTITEQTTQTCTVVIHVASSVASWAFYIYFRTMCNLVLRCNDLKSCVVNKVGFRMCDCFNVMMNIL